MTDLAERPADEATAAMEPRGNGEVALSVRDLKAFFYTNRRCNKAVNGVSFEIRRGKTLCVVGESGCGKSVTAAAIMQLLPRLSRIEEGEIVYHAERGDIHIEQFARNGREMRAIRGAEISMIFQDPMTALNPVFTIGFQIGENLLYHTRLRGRQLKVAVQGTNLGLWSNYRGVDPNVNQSMTEYTRDGGILPQPRVWQLTLGIN